MSAGAPGNIDDSIMAVMTLEPAETLEQNVHAGQRSRWQDDDHTKGTSHVGSMADDSLRTSRL